MTAHPIAPPAAAPRHPPPLALYLHLPWCGRKCPYCDFNSHQSPAPLPETAYADALIADMQNALPTVWGRPLSSIFIGGGTPSLFSPATIARILDTVRALFNPPPHTEITMEANPDSSDAGKFAEFRAAGINRLSLGIQSFTDHSLRALGRLHDAAAAHRAAAAARRAYDNFNLDLMFALPAQTPAQAAADLAAALGYAPPHLSLYQLTMEPGTPFHRRPPPHLPDPDTAADIADTVRDTAQQAGYLQYEVSAYATPRRQCRHNLNYWRFGDYLGIGAGAHGKISTPTTVTRSERVKHPGDYMRRLSAAADPVIRRRTLTRADIACEFMLNALRLTDGFPPALLTAHTGAGTPHLRRALDQAAAADLIERRPHLIRPTAKGMRYLDDLVALFLPPTPSSPAAS